jgi:predicted small lipoprotein YifL
MKAMLAPLAIALLSLGVAACGSAGKATRYRAPSESNSADTATLPPQPATSSTSPGSYWRYDGDKDSDDFAHSGKRPDDDDDRNLLAPYPNSPSRAELQAIVAAVRGYYAAAAAGDGTQACRLLDTSLAAGLGEGASQPGHGSDSSCEATIDRLFKEQHQQLAIEQPATMVVTSVHVKGDLGLALLGFRKAPEGEILIERDRGTWKLGALFDSEIP